VLGVALELLTDGTVGDEAADLGVLRGSGELVVREVDGEVEEGSRG
jgi:hypothetical protein